MTSIMPHLTTFATPYNVSSFPNIHLIMQSGALGLPLEDLRIFGSGNKARTNRPVHQISNRSKRWLPRLQVSWHAVALSHELVGVYA